jgi:hypothetical protein
VAVASGAQAFTAPFQGTSRGPEKRWPLTHTTPASWREMALVPAKVSGWNFMLRG